MRHVPDAAIIVEREDYSTCWGRQYMSRVSGSNLSYLVSAIPKMAKVIPIADTISVSSGVRLHLKLTNGREQREIDT